MHSSKCVFTHTDRVKNIFLFYLMIFFFPSLLFFFFCSCASSPLPTHPLSLWSSLCENFLHVCSATLKELL